MNRSFYSFVSAIMRTRLALGLCVAPLLSSCAGAETIAPTLDVMGEIGRAMVSKKCSHPGKVATTPIRNRYIPSVTDEIQTYTCTGFVVQVYVARAMNVKRELPSKVVLTGRRSPFPKALSVGSRAADVRAILGDPFRLEGQNLVYSLSDEDFPGEDTLTFNVSAKLVRSIEWNWKVE